MAASERAGRGREAGAMQVLEKVGEGGETPPAPRPSLVSKIALEGRDVPLIGQQRILGDKPRAMRR